MSKALSVKRAIKKVDKLESDFDRLGSMAVRAALKHGLDDAREKSSGPFSSLELAQDLDHPYATRHGAPLLPTEIINYQSGDFYRAWGSEGPFVETGRIHGAIFNDDEKADWLKDGNEFTFARDIEGSVMQATNEDLLGQLEYRLALS